MKQREMVGFMLLSKDQNASEVPLVIDSELECLKRHKQALKLLMQTFFYGHLGQSMRIK